MELDGDIMVYNSVDGPGISNKMRQSVHAPQQLALKVGTPVILIKKKSIKSLSQWTHWCSERHEQ